jgi:extracellular elastinolytic metalloproteinase
LKYIVGNVNIWQDTPYDITTESEYIPIRIDPSASITQTSWKNEEWEIFPNPSQGEVYIRQESEPDGVIMRVYDLNGRVQKSDILQESLKNVDLITLSKGTYIVSLENHGEVKSKRLIIQ